MVEPEAGWDMDVELVKRPLRAVRRWPPLNLALTKACRAGLDHLGIPTQRLVRYLPRVGLVEAPLPVGGPLRMWSRGDDQIASMVYWSGWDGHEPESGREFFRLARSAHVTIDIGAHVGYFALLAAHANPGGRVYAFEPLPAVFERLQGNRALNNLSNLTCLPLAVGAEAGVAQFFHVGFGIPSSSSLSREFMESVVDQSHLTSSEVEVVTIDDFVDNQGIVDVNLVKVDTETTEDAVFQGMTRTLSRHRPLVFCEILREDIATRIEAILRPLDYRFFLLTGGGRQLREHIAPEPPWRNYLFCPEEHRDRDPGAQSPTS